jgi:acetyltransferase
MTIRNLDKIFKPRRIAVIGASNTQGTVGYTLLRNLIGSGYNGVVYPINPKHEAVQGIEAHRNVAELPHAPDLAIVCTPGASVPGVVRECGEAGVRGIVIISAGFREVGDAGRQLEDQVRAEASKFDGMRIVGPNCLGFIVPSLHLNASFAAGTPKPGRIAFISQSGALCTSVLDWALETGVGFSHFVSIGNMLDVGVDDLIDYFAADAHTESLILYVESVTEAREFMSAARAFARKKPIVAYKAGRFAESAHAAASHTGALAGVDAVYEAAFERAGIERVFAVDDMFDCAELLARQTLPRGARLAIVTNAGGPGVMAVDQLISRQGVLAQLSPETISQLNAKLPPFWSHGNPVDVLGDAPAERYADAVAAVLADPGVDAVLVVLTPQAMTDPTSTARAVAKAIERPVKPVLAAWMGGPAVRPGRQILIEAGIPTYGAPEAAVRAFMHLVSYARNRETLYETPRDVPVAFQLDRSQIRTRRSELLGGPARILSEDASKELLSLYGIPITQPVAAEGADAAVAAARQIGYPVVLKVLSPDITHKTDVGGVLLNLTSDREVREAFDKIVASAREKRPDARIEGVTVQPMVVASKGFELILGSKQDPVFGSVILVGMGGVAAEVFQDRALGLPPLNERLAYHMLESLRSWPLLKGYRGRPGVDLERLVEVLMRFSYLVAESPEIQELDINPLLVMPDRLIALDARVVVGPGVARPARPYAHLAIHPYPEEFVQERSLNDGTRVVLRPIKPEDEPMWHELLASCSAQSLWFRFRYLFKEATHEMASRFCFIDYDRELAIVAEIEEDGRRRLIGTGRLVADVDHVTAEYAVLVVDAWQGRGVGSVLTDYCLEIARQWNVRQVFGETSTDNARMLGLFRNRGFTLRQDEPQTVLAEKSLG